MLIDYNTVYKMDILNLISQITGALILIVGGASILAKLTSADDDNKVIDMVLGFLNGMALNSSSTKARK